MNDKKASEVNNIVEDSLNGGSINSEQFRDNTLNENLKGMGGMNRDKRVQTSPSRWMKDNGNRNQGSNT